MDFDVRLKALERLSKSRTPAADTALRKEIAKATDALENETEFERLSQNIQILEKIGHCASSTTFASLARFCTRLRAIEITYGTEASIFGEDAKNYYSADMLASRAIEALLELGYLETIPLLELLLELALEKSQRTKDSANQGLEKLAAYRIDVIFGGNGTAGIGFHQQKLLTDKISSFAAPDLRRYFSPLIVVADALLSPTMESTSWTYNSVTLSHGQVPATADLPDIRRRTIKFLERLYAVAPSNAEQLQAINSLYGATRAHTIGAANGETAAMLADNALEVLSFFKSLVLTEDFPIVQKIEHHAYWIFYHAIDSEVAASAREVEAALAAQSEYQIYKTLIGFEGIFEDWEVAKGHADRYLKRDEYRNSKAREFVSEITPATENTWRDRILKFAETKSNDLATFPTFYYFLTELASAHPDFALKLAREDTQQLEPFLIPIVRALFSGPKHNEIAALVRDWCSQGKYLRASIKQFLANPALDRQLLGTLFGRAVELDDLVSVSLVVSVAVSNYSEDNGQLVNEFFLPAIRVLTQHGNADWIADFWFRREARTLLKTLDRTAIDTLLENLMHAKDIDYELEEILYLLAEKEPTKVIDFLVARLARHIGKDRGTPQRLFEAIPHQLHKLNDALSKIPDYAVSTIRATYNGDYGTFIYHGARLLHIIFPTFSPDFEAELLRVLGNGAKTDLEFVAAVLRNYENNPAIQHVAREMILRLPNDSPFRTEVAIALEGTGVVTGEFGLAEAYERKREEIKPWLDDPDEKIRDFAKWYTQGLEQMAASERKRAEESIALRKHMYGESN